MKHIEKMNVKAKWNRKGTLHKEFVVHFFDKTCVTKQTDTSKSDGIVKWSDCKAKPNHNFKRCRSHIVQTRKNNTSSWGTLHLQETRKRSAQNRSLLKQQQPLAHTPIVASVLGNMYQLELFKFWVIANISHYIQHCYEWTLDASHLRVLYDALGGEYSSGKGSSHYSSYKRVTLDGAKRGEWDINRWWNRRGVIIKYEMRVIEVIAINDNHIKYFNITSITSTFTKID